MEQGSFGTFESRYIDLGFDQLVDEVAAWTGDVPLNAILAALSRFVEIASDAVELTTSKRERAVGLAVALERYARRALDHPEHRPKLEAMEAAIAMSLHVARTYGQFPGVADAISARRSAKGLPPLSDP